MKKSARKRIPYVGFMICFFLIPIFFLIAMHRVEANYEGKMVTMLGLVYDRNPEIAEELLTTLWEEQTGYESKAQELFQSYGYGEDHKKYWNQIQGKLQWGISFLGGYLCLFILFGILREKRERVWRQERKQWHLEKEFWQQEVRKREETYLENARILTENISHQIRTRTATLSLCLERLEDASLSIKEREKIRVALLQIDYIRKLMGVLMKTGQLEKGRVRFSFVYTDLNILIQKAISQISQLYPESHIIFTPVLENVQLPVDEIWLEEAVFNLVQNCILYSSDQDSVCISLEKESEYWKIRVRDHGIGVEKEEESLIWDRFYRGSNKHKQEGFGIGLNLVRLIIEAHHGSVGVERQEKGSLFFIRLPK